MDRFKNILLVEAGRRLTPDIVKRAAALARRNDAQLKVLSVLTPARGFTRLLMGRDTTEAVWKTLAHERATRALDLLGQLGMPGTCQVVVGPTSERVLERIRRDGHDLVLAVAEARRSSSFGREVQKLLRVCPTPVWALRDEPPRKDRKLLAAVDVHADEGDGLALQKKILEMASSLAERQGAELHVVSVWSPRGAELLARRTGDPKALDRLVTALRQEHHRGVMDLLDTVPAARDRAHVHLRRGGAAESIQAVADEEDIDVLVMGTVGRTGLSGMLVGNTAEAVLGRVGCELLAVKPDDGAAAAQTRAA